MVGYSGLNGGVRKMNRGRIEAFTDAVLAIILTIMILEFKVPESFQLSAMLAQLPYLISYAIGYLFIGTAWYNHHYMFTQTRHITRDIYWTNNFWMFTTSFLPVATAWVGRGINKQGPEIFYFIVYSAWSFAYVELSRSLIKANEASGHPEVATNIKRMNIYRYLTNWKLVLIQTIVMVIILMYLPALQMVVVVMQIVLVGMRFNEDSDRLDG
ncbi:hypothetical protein FC17_GL002507 [Secundilactobacillus paracollinoides DSM 15502 = JCM 11969]|nr:hypothetical protein FC17_GL002507 [Secundilactobacillus paracollinoides DSM 15502 = JCM 11969]